MDTYDICVIGGGISGSSFAFHCAESGARVLLLEASSSFGCIHSVTLDACGQIELGAHGMTNKYQEVIKLIQASGLVDQVRPQDKLRLSLNDRGQFKSVRSSLNWGQALLAMPQALWTTKDGKTLAEYYSTIAGSQNYYNVLRHAFTAVTSQDANHFPAATLFKKRQTVADWPKKFTLEGGFASLVHALRTHPNIELKTSSAAETLINRGEQFEIASNGHTYIAESIALATPAHISAKLSQDADPEASKVLSSIGRAKIHSTLIRSSCPNTPNHGAFYNQPPFYSAIHVNKDHFVLHSDGERSAPTRDECAAALNLTPDCVEVLKQRQTELPRITLQNESAVRKLKKSQLFFPCNYIQGISLEDCCTQSAEEFARWQSR